MVEVDGQMWPASVARELQKNHLDSLTSWSDSELDAPPAPPAETSTFTAADDERARTLQGNLPQLYLKIQPFSSSPDFHRRAYLRQHTMLGI